MQPLRTFNADQVRAAIQDYLDKTVTLEVIAAQFEVSQHKFLQWVELDKQFRAADKPVEKCKSETFKLKDVMPKEMKSRKNLSEQERKLVWEAIEAGGSLAFVANRFGVSKSTISNLKFKWKSKTPSFALSSPVQEPSPAPIQAIKLVNEEDIGVTFEGDFIVLRITKKSITKELLKDLL